MKTPHPHPDILTAYAADTSVKIEIYVDGTWRRTEIDKVLAYPEQTFRLKPKRLTVIGMNGKEYSFPEPMRVAPKPNTLCWLVYFSIVHKIQWDESYTYRNQLSLGICQATEQGAIEQRAALIAVCGGVV